MSQEKEVILEKAEVLLKYITTGIEKGSELVVEQVPLVVQEILTYGLVYHGVWLVIVITVLILSIWLFMCSLRELKKDNDHWVSGLMISGLVGGGSVVFTIVNTLALLKITYAPRIYLLEMMHRLL